MSKRPRKFDIIKYIHDNDLGAPIARACRISRQAVGQWPEVPSKRVLIVAKVTRVARHRIRPDLYPRAA